MARKTFKMVGGRKLQRHLRQMQTRKGAAATIGVHSDQRHPDGTPVATAAAINEFGSATIPPRPALSTALRAAFPKCRAAARALYRTAIRGGQPPDPRVVVEACAEIIRDEMEESIRSGLWSRNAPATLEKKGSSQPLIDSDRYARGIAWRWHTGGHL